MCIYNNTQFNANAMQSTIDCVVCGRHIVIPS